jgi:hypothetical protein
MNTNPTPEKFCYIVYNKLFKQCNKIFKVCLVNIGTQVLLVLHRLPLGHFITLPL